MIQKKVICDRCKKVVFDSEQKAKATDIFDALVGTNTDQEIGYAEINVIRFDGTVTHTVHLCEKCYDIAVKALNER